MTVRLHDPTRRSHSCPFFQAGREQLCTAVSGGMRCSLHEIENFCTNEDHQICPVHRERTQSEQPVPTEVYEVRLVELEYEEHAW